MEQQVEADELDNTENAIVDNAEKINQKLATITDLGGARLAVRKIEDYTLYTDYLLDPISISHEAKIIALFPNKHRFSVWHDTIDVNLAEEEPENYADLGEYFPATRKTLIIRRQAFKALQRPVVLTLLWRTFLLTLLSLCFYGLYFTIVK